jgi:hypothetical protein
MFAEEAWFFQEVALLSTRTWLFYEVGETLGQ